MTYGDVRWFGVPVAVNALVSINLTVVAPCLARLGSLGWAIVSEQEKPFGIQYNKLPRSTQPSTIPAYVSRVKAKRVHLGQVAVFYHFLWALQSINQSIN